MGNPRETAVLTPLSDRISLNPVISAGPQDWQSDQFRNQVQAYLDEAPDQAFFNRTDVMRATGRADNFTNKSIQMTMAAMYRQFGGSEGASLKVRHIRLTREGFMEACRLLGPRNDALVRTATNSDVPKRNWETYGRKEGVNFNLNAHPREKKPANGLKKLSQEELLDKVNTFIAENKKPFYSIADISRATGRRIGPTRTMRRVIREKLSENGITTFQHPDVPEDLFRQTCLAVGVPDPRISQARKQYWQEKGVKARPKVPEDLIHELRKRGKITPSAIELSQQRVTVKGVLKELLSMRTEALPPGFVNGLVNFFGDFPAKYYLLSDVLTATGRSPGGNPDLREKAVALIEAEGIKREYKTGMLPIPLRLALSICLEIGSRHDQLPRTRLPVSLPVEPRAARAPKGKDKVTKEIQIFPKPQNDEVKEGPFTLDIHKTFGLVTILRAPLNQAILERYKIIISDELRQKMNSIADPLTLERRKMGNIAPDLELEVLPELFQYLLEFAEGDREEILKQISQNGRMLLTPLVNLTPEKLTALVHELYDQYLM